ncbi:MAG TPA: thiamine pyrophosphate-binding protein, partial [Thermoanaerobaculia bacterium]
MGNVDLARRLIGGIRRAGAREFCVCAGSRNSPLLYQLGSSDARLFSFFDERSAAFFALGRAKLHGDPVCVVTTSGTAVAELLPAAIEAYYSGVPLILLTADRPARYRGTGAPQSIEQVGIFGIYAETSLETWSRTKALHLNVEFDEPLIDDSPVILSEATDPLPTSAVPGVSLRGEGVLRFAQDDRGRRPLVLIGGLAAKHRERVKQFALALNAPVYAEPLSGLREDADLPLVRNERMLARGGFGSVIRIGNVPTLRFWRDLETSALPIVHYSDLPFTGLTRGELHPLEALPEVTARDRDEAFFAEDREQSARFEALLAEEPRSELAMFRALSEELPHGARVYLGNSLPIREWDLAATRDNRGFAYEANRGANGIDGQLSTFFGQCEAGRENVCVAGDLTALYDLNAPWVVSQLEDVAWRIVIVNNGGGRIFSRVASLRSMDAAMRERIIENSHAVRFADWAAMWNIVEHVTELLPDAESSRRLWQKYDEL